MDQSQEELNKLYLILLKKRWMAEKTENSADIYNARRQAIFIAYAILIFNFKRNPTYKYLNSFADLSNNRSVAVTFTTVDNNSITATFTADEIFVENVFFSSYKANNSYSGLASKEKILKYAVRFLFVLESKKKT